MTTKAVRYTQPLLGVRENDPIGYIVLVPGVSVLITQDGVECDVFADTEMTPLSNPVPTGVDEGEAGVDTFGQLTVFLAPGRGYGGTSTAGTETSSFIISDISLDFEEPLPAGAVEEAMLAFGVATQAELDDGLATKAPSTGIAQSAVSNLVSDLAAKATPAQISAAIAALSGTYPQKFSPSSPKPGREMYLMDYLSGSRTPGTTQDTSGFLSAVAASEGNTLIISPGLYRMNDVVEWDGLDNVTVIAYGATIVLDDDGTATGRMFRAKHCEGFRWFGGRLQMTAAARAAVYGLLSLEDVTDFRISEIETVGGSGTGLYLQQATHGSIDSPRVRDCKADGIHLTRGTTDVQVNNPVVRNPGDDAVAVVSNTNDGATVYSQCARVNITAPLVSGGSDVGSGVALVGAKNCTVTGGNVDDVPANILFVGGGGSYHNASGLRVVGLTGQGADKGFLVGPSTNTYLGQCTAEGCADVGVFLTTGSVNAYVDGGRFSGNVGGVYENAGTGNQVHDADLRGNSGFAQNVVSATLVDCITA